MILGTGWTDVGYNAESGLLRVLLPTPLELQLEAPGIQL